MFVIFKSFDRTMSPTSPSVTDRRVMVLHDLERDHIPLLIATLGSALRGEWFPEGSLIESSFDEISNFSNLSNKKRMLEIIKEEYDRVYYVLEKHAPSPPTKPAYETAFITGAVSADMILLIQHSKIRNITDKYPDVVDQTCLRVDFKSKTEEQKIELIQQINQHQESVHHVYIPFTNSNSVDIHMGNTNVVMSAGSDRPSDSLLDLIQRLSATNMQQQQQQQQQQHQHNNVVNIASESRPRDAPIRPEIGCSASRSARAYDRLRSSASVQDVEGLPPPPCYTDSLSMPILQTISTATTSATSVYNPSEINSVIVGGNVYEQNNVKVISGAAVGGPGAFAIHVTRK
jgi:hypothetical protein